MKDRTGTTRTRTPTPDVFMAIRPLNGGGLRYYRLPADAVRRPDETMTAFMSRAGAPISRAEYQRGTDE